MGCLRTAFVLIALERFRLKREKRKKRKQCLFLLTITYKISSICKIEKNIIYSNNISTKIIENFIKEFLNNNLISNIFIN